MINISGDQLGIKVFDLTSTGNVTATTYENNLLTPPQGFIYKIIGIRASVAAVAGSGGSGTHQLIGTFSQTSTDFTLNMAMYQIISAYTSALSINPKDGFAGDSSETPSTYPEQLKIITDTIFCNNSNPFNLQYYNGSDLTQTNDRNINVMVQVFKEKL